MDKEINMLGGEKRIFIEQVGFRLINGMYYLVLRSGETENAYVMPLSVAKSMARGVMGHIEEFEKKNGIKVPSQNSNDPLPSPIQMKKSDDSNDG